MERKGQSELFIEKFPLIICNISSEKYIFSNKVYVLQSITDKPTVLVIKIVDAYIAL